MVDVERPADYGGTATAIGLAGRPRERPRRSARACSGRVRLGPGGAWEAASRWTDERLAAERARVLRRLGRWAEAAEAWQTAAAAGGGLGVIAWIEVAKLREHRLGDPGGRARGDARRVAAAGAAARRWVAPTRASRRTSSGAGRDSRPASRRHGGEVAGVAP